MAQDLNPRQTAPTCVQEVGSKRPSRLCGDPARYGLVVPRSDRLVAMCEFHAWWAMDRAGFEIAVEWPTPSGDDERS